MVRILQLAQRPVGEADAEAGDLAQRPRSQQPALSLFAMGMMGLGVLALKYGDFALVWQPVASWVPGRTALAYLSGVIMLLGGVGLLSRATVRWAVRVLFLYCVVWALLKVPALVVAWRMEAVWLGIGELTVLLAGAHGPCLPGSRRSAKGRLWRGWPGSAGCGWRGTCLRCP
jgi:uncharacterized membrane protein